jgi:ribonuclease R
MKTNKTKKTQKQSLHFDALKTLTQEFLKKHHSQAFRPKQILKGIRAQNSEQELMQVLNRLVQIKKIKLDREGKYQIFKKIPESSPLESKEKTKRGNYIEGRVESIRSGAAYLISDQSPEDIYIPSKFLGGAIHGDIVRVQLAATHRRKPEGKIIEIIERKTKFFIGQYRLRKQIGMVFPNSIQYALEIHIALADNLGAQDGDPVVVEIVHWRDGSHKYPKGRVIQILDRDSPIDTEMKSILINNGFPLEFSPEAMAIADDAAAQMHDGLTWPDRRDFRGQTTFTIDPATARDFDDALSVTRLPDGNLEIGVHIADASHYLVAGTALDHEAFARATSVYLVDRALPMLPEVLSGDVCSLKPFTDRLTFSVVFVFDLQRVKVISTWIGKSVIHSNHRYTYEEAQVILDKKEGLFFPELDQLNNIAQSLRKTRFQHGSIGFESPEYQFELDPASGKPMGLKEKIRKDSHLLIEEYMLLANKAVAEYIHAKEKNQDTIPFVYRIHDVPDTEKLRDLAAFAKELGFDFRMNTPKEISNSLNLLYEKSQENETLKVLAPLGIRAMAKAAYSTHNIGHYGLAFDFYSHFTSPIRRYSDILAHRILAECLTKVTRVNKTKLEEDCKHISNQERKAMEAERESVRYFQLLYIQDHVGTEFDGLISGLIDRGIFVELIDNHVEGFIPFEKMAGRFQLSDNRLKAFSSGGLSFAIGEKIRVKVMAADMTQRRVELAWVNS